MSKRLGHDDGYSQSALSLICLMLHRGNRSAHHYRVKPDQDVNFWPYKTYYCNKSPNTVKAQVMGSKAWVRGHDQNTQLLWETISNLVIPSTIFGNFDFVVYMYISEQGLQTLQGYSQGLRLLNICLLGSYGLYLFSNMAMVWWELLVD